MSKEGIVAAAVILGILAVLCTVVILIYMPVMPVIPKCPDCNCPEPVITTVNQTIEVPALSILDQSLATFMEAVKNEEDPAGNEIDLLMGYDFDEVSVNKVFDNYTVSADGDKTIVEFQVRLKYKEAGESYEKETYNVRVTTETDEDTIVEIL